MVLKHLTFAMGCIPSNLADVPIVAKVQKILQGFQISYLQIMFDKFDYILQNYRLK